MTDRFAGRGIGIDFGTKRIGVALCDSNGVLATPYETLQRSGSVDVDHRRLAELVEEADAAFVVVGVPYALRDGSVTASAASILAEVEVLRKQLPEGCNLHLQDERLTSVTAEQRLTELGIKGPRRKQLVDQIAASVILQTWLDAEH
ncbi:MAG: Holliday junction resolvase RuvX [Acidimicrobiales bacterium]